MLAHGGAMNTKLKSKKVIIPTVAALVVLVGGGAVVAASVADERRDEVPADVRTTLSEAALAEVGAEGAIVTDVEANDDSDGPAAYEVEVRTPEGAEYDVWFDADQNIIFSGLDTDHEGRGSGSGESGSGESGAEPGAAGTTTVTPAPTEVPDADERVVDGILVDDSDAPLADADVARVAAAATRAVPGTVTQIDTHVADADDTGTEAATAYEVEVRSKNGTVHEVRLDADLKVLATLTED